jgi:hypothetical protein
MAQGNAGRKTTVFLETIKKAIDQGSAAKIKPKAAPNSTIFIAKNLGVEVLNFSSE